MSHQLFSLFYFLQLWRISESEFQFRTFQGQFLTYDGEGGFISATEESPSATETFYLERNFNSRVHIRNKHGTYLQVLLLVHLPLRENLFPLNDSLPHLKYTESLHFRVSSFSFHGNGHQHPH